MYSFGTMSSTFCGSTMLLARAAWPAAQPQMSKSSRGPSGPWRRCPPRSWCPPTCPRRQPDALTNIFPRRHHDSARLPCQRVDQQLRTPPGAQTLMREVASARIVRPAFVRDHGHVLPPTDCGHRALRARCGTQRRKMWLESVLMEA